jgi:hypothetical protein
MFFGGLVLRLHFTVIRKGGILGCGLPHFAFIFFCRIASLLSAEPVRLKLSQVFEINYAQCKPYVELTHLSFSGSAMNKKPVRPRKNFVCHIQRCRCFTASDRHFCRHRLRSAERTRKRILWITGSDERTSPIGPPAWLGRVRGQAPRPPQERG